MNESAEYENYHHQSMNTAAARTATRAATLGFIVCSLLAKLGDREVFAWSDEPVAYGPTAPVVAVWCEPIDGMCTVVLASGVLP
jgi:hypothetical protein